MIRIERSPCPDCLTDAPSEGTRYRREQVVRALWKMQHGKCCYSEMRLPKSGHGKAVEHFHPQALFHWLRNEWCNLLLVCPQCNGRKSDRFPALLTENEDEVKVIYLQAPSDDFSAIIDPSDPGDDNPEQHLTYVLDDTDPFYGQVVPRDESLRGRATIEVTGIDDDVFFRERFDVLNEVLDGQYRNLLRARQNGDDDAVNAARASFEDYIKPTAKFAGLAREYARRKKLDEYFGIEIPGMAS